MEERKKNDISSLKKKKNKKNEPFSKRVMKKESKERAAARAKRRKGNIGGTFVYQGAGKVHNKDATLGEIKCEKHTIDLQWCLAKHDHKQKYCEDLVKVLKNCMIKYR